ncbi:MULTISPECIES: hypothetical protein [unclassified Sedimentibacter]|uniref:hypothetical protein n=1 Tax=unclassified Sedimentibacter TaxID=2649220 RepID=UPI0027E1CDD8|nr:hypothetical protein [Sedimentibacter sp. MB35-C1]WMJ77326.1 hypothetical protein RBQ61_17445 [Sedimentibacter sp. MB35-C1]
MLRKHILSKYAEVCDLKLNSTITSRNEGATHKTNAIENSDPDEFCFDLTRETRTIEISDPDEFVFSEKTKLTFVVENSDPDEFYINSTRMTKTIEISDPDEFCLN